MTTKLGKVVSYCWKTPLTKSRDLSITWSRDKCETLYLHFHNTYVTKFGRVVTCGGGTPTSKSHDLLLKKTYIRTSTISMTTKLGRVITYDGGTSSSNHLTF